MYEEPITQKTSLQKSSVHPPSFQDRFIVGEVINEEYLNNNKSIFTSNVTFSGCMFEVGAGTLTDFHCRGLFFFQCVFLDVQLTLVNCRNLQILVLDDVNISELVLDTPNLNSLRVDKCPYLNSIDSNTEILQDITIVKCDWLKKIVFPNNELFAKIRRIKIVGCPKITEIQLKLDIERINKLFKAKKLNIKSKKAIETFNGILNQSTTQKSKGVTTRNFKQMSRRKPRRSMRANVGTNNS